MDKLIINELVSGNMEWGFSQHALLSGCDGGNGVYSFFTAFFFGSRRLAKFLWRNLGRKRSQFCDRSSGSLASSRLIISVCEEKKKVYDNKLYFRLWLYVSSSSFMPSAPGCATSAYTPREVDSQSRGQEQGWKTSSWGMNLNILVPPLLFLSSYLYIIDGMDVLHRVHHDFAYLREREGLVISKLTHTARWEYFKVKSLFGRQSWLSF